MTTSKKNHIALNEKGFGMIGFLMAAVVGLIVIGGLAESMLTMTRSQQSAEMSAEGQLFGDQLQVALENENSCKSIMQAAQGGTPINITNPDGLEKTLHVKIGDRTLDLHSGAQIMPNLKIASLKLAAMPTVTVSNPQNNPPLNPVKYAMSFDPRVYGLRYRMKLVYQTQKVDGAYSPISKPREIPLSVTTDLSHRIQGCVAESADTKACEQMGGIWNPVGVAGKKCVSLQNCDWGGSYARVTTSDIPSSVSFVNQITGGYTCPPEFTATQTGSIVAAKRSGKTNIKNVYAPVMSCLRCGSDQASAGGFNRLSSFDLGFTDAEVGSIDNRANDANAQYDEAGNIISGANQQYALTQQQIQQIQQILASLGSLGI